MFYIFKNVGEVYQLAYFILFYFRSKIFTVSRIKPYFLAQNYRCNLQLQFWANWPERGQVAFMYGEIRPHVIIGYNGRNFENS